MKKLPNRIPPSARRLLGYLFALIVIAFFVAALAGEWPKLAAYDWRLNWGYLAIFAVILFIRPALSLLGWRWLVLKLGGPLLPWAQAVHVYFSASLSRYLPGSVWYAVGRVALGERVGVGRMVGSLSVLLETAFVTFTGLLISPLALAATPLLDTTGKLQLFAIAYAVFSLAALVVMWRSDLFFARLNWGLKLVERQPVTVQLAFRDLLLLNLPYLASWLLYALMSYLLTAAVYPLPFADAPTVGASFVAAWAVGFLTFIAPNGLGVREGTLVFLLGGLVPNAIALIIAALSRIASIIAELPWVVAGVRGGQGVASYKSGVESITNDGESETGRDSPPKPPLGA